MQDFQRQLDALKEMQSFLSHFCLELTDKIADYNEWVNKMFSIGVEKGAAEKFEDDYLTVITRHINSIIDSIEREQLPFIRRQIESTEKIL